MFDGVDPCSPTPRHGQGMLVLEVPRRVRDAERQASAGETGRGGVKLQLGGDRRLGAPGSVGISEVVCLLVVACATSCGRDSARPPRTPPVGATTARAAGTVLFSVGQHGDVPAEQFVDVRGAVLLSDGRVVVAEASTQELRVFDKSGRSLGSWGRMGEGPGEFRGLDGVYLLPRDTVVAYDINLGRFTELDSSGRVVSTTRDTSGIAYIAGVLPGSRAVRYKDFATYGAVGVIVDDSFDVTVRSFGGDRLAELGPYPGRTRYAQSTAGLDLDFLGRTTIAAGADHIAVWTPRSGSVSVFRDDDGAPRRIPLGYGRRSAPAGAVADWVSSRAGGGRGPMSARVWTSRKATVAAAGATVPFPDSLPLVGDLRFGTDGDLWVGEYDPRYVHPHRWRRYRDEKLLGTYSIPGSRFRVDEFTADRVLIDTWNSLDEPLVQVLALRG